MKYFFLFLFFHRMLILSRNSFKYIAMCQIISSLAGREYRSLKTHPDSFSIKLIFFSLRAHLCEPVRLTCKFRILLSTQISVA